MTKASTALTIRSILLGPNPTDCLRWTVGQIRKMKINGVEGNYIISSIVEDQDYTIKYGGVSYLIYVKEEGGKEMLHSRYNNIPASITYEI